eukprot:scaffold7923_cov154-Skeletonema_menzelii.AAC.10
MYWSKVIIASLVASPSFARLQRLGGHVEIVGEGMGFDEPPSTQFGSRRSLKVDAYGLEPSKYDEQGIEKNDEVSDAIEPEDFPQVDENGFFDLASYLDPDFLSQLSDEDRSSLFGYIGEDVEQQVARHLGKVTSTSQCGDRKMFVLKIKADSKSPGDNEFKVFFNGSRVMMRGPFSSAVQVYAGMCVPAGQLKVEVTDARGDGMQDGSYEVSLDGEVVGDEGSGNWSKRVHTIDTSSSTSGTTSSGNNPSPTGPPTPAPTPAPNTVISGRNTCFEPRTNEEADYLDEHNASRQKYHKIHGVEYKPLQWSNDLADSAASYANELLKYCCTGTLIHDKTNGGRFGENLASNCGGSASDWGKKPAAENILRRWVDREHKQEFYDFKRHYTQVLWRGTEQVGCGVAERDMGNGKTCHMQVCRYQKPGNCGANQSNYLERMLADSSGCKGEPVDC